MAGKIKTMIDTIVDENSKGDPTVASMTKTKLILKGINPNKFNEFSEDDPIVIDKLKSFANELGIKL